MIIDNNSHLEPDPLPSANDEFDSGRTDATLFPLYAVKEVARIATLEEPSFAEKHWRRGAQAVLEAATSRYTCSYCERSAGFVGRGQDGDFYCSGHLSRSPGYVDVLLDD